MTQEVPWISRKTMAEVTIGSGHPLPFTAGNIYDFGEDIGVRVFNDDTEALRWYIREVQQRPALLKAKK